MYLRKSLKLGVAAAVLAAVMPLSAANADGKITIGLGSEPTSIDPHFHNLGPNNQIAQHIFSRWLSRMKSSVFHLALLRAGKRSTRPLGNLNFARM